MADKSAPSDEALVPIEDPSGGTKQTVMVSADAVAEYLVTHPGAVCLDPEWTPAAAKATTTTTSKTSTTTPSEPTS
jgi:hypothetical protein